MRIHQRGLNLDTPSITDPQRAKGKKKEESPGFFNKNREHERERESVSFSVLIFGEKN